MRESFLFTWRTYTRFILRRFNENYYIGSSFKNIKYSVVDEPYAVVNLYQKLKNALIGFMEDINMNEPSQFKILELKNMDLPLQRLLDYFSSQIKESFTEKLIDIKYVKSLKNLITNAMKTLYNSGSDNDSEKSLTDEELDDIEKGFNTLIYKTTKTSSAVFEQSFHVSSNGIRKSKSTPGEKGSNIIKIEIIQASDVARIPIEDRWKCVAKKAVFVTKSSTDPLRQDVNNILKSVFENMKKIKNLKTSQMVLSKRNRFQTY